MGRSLGRNTGNNIGVNMGRDMSGRVVLICALSSSYALLSGEPLVQPEARPPAHSHCCHCLSND